MADDLNYGYKGADVPQSFGNNKGVFDPSDINNLVKDDKWTNYGQLELIETKVITGDPSSVSLDDLGTGYNVHFITFTNMHTDDNRDQNLRVKVGGVTQTSSSYGRAFRVSNSAGGYDDKDATLDRLRILAEVGNATGECWTGSLYMYNALDSSKYTFFTTNNVFISFHPYFSSSFGSGSYNVSNVLSGLEFYPSSSVQRSGTISLYGIKEYS